MAIYLTKDGGALRNQKPQFTLFQVEKDQSWEGHSRAVQAQLAPVT